MSGQDSVSCAKMVALTCWPFELTPLNEFYRGSMCYQYLLYPLRYFDDIWYTCISGQDGVSRSRMVALLCLAFELSFLNELYRGKPVRSITLISFEIF